MITQPPKASDNTIRSNDVKIRHNRPAKQQDGGVENESLNDYMPA